MKGLVLVTLLFSGCATKKLAYDVGQDFDKHYPVQQHRDKILTSGGSHGDGWSYVQGSVTYDLAISKENKVSYISTKDERFKTDGLRIGDTYTELKKKHPETKTYCELGWGLYVLLPSGWHAFFRICYSGDKEIDGTEKIICFFKRHK